MKRTQTIQSPVTPELYTAVLSLICELQRQQVEAAHEQKESAETEATETEEPEEPEKTPPATGRKRGAMATAHRRTVLQSAAGRRQTEVNS